MVGAICKSDVLFHPIVTIRCFGWTVFFRAAFAGGQATFLSLLTEAGTFRQSATPLGDLLDRCIELEEQAMRLYRSLSVQHAQEEPVREFFEHLAYQEECHAELLSVCRAVTPRRVSQPGCFDAMTRSLPRTRARLDRAEALLRQQPSLHDVLQLVIELESSQINDLFTQAVTATDPRLDRRFRAFRGAIRDHLGYIRERIPRLAPELREACQALACPE